MISGANEEELELANIRGEIILATDLKHLDAVDKHYEKEIDRLNNIINEIEKELENIFSKMEEKQIEIDSRGYYYTDLLPIEEVLDKLKELKENK